MVGWSRRGFGGLSHRSKSTAFILGGDVVNNAEKQAAFKARKKAMGLKRVQIFMTPAEEALVKNFIDTLRATINKREKT